jgi:hypothetical protein
MLSLPAAFFFILAGASGGPVQEPAHGLARVRENIPEIFSRHKNHLALLVSARGGFFIAGKN